jgi:purine-cytosine permease-like protein
MAVVAAAASYNITFAPYVSDYTRYLPRTTKTSHLVIGVFVGACSSLVWLIAMGAWLASRAGASDALVALNASGNHMVTHLGTLLAVLSAAALIATIGIDTYSAVIGVATMVDCFKPVVSSKRFRIKTTGVLFAIWLLVALNVGNNQQTLIYNLLNILLYLLVPWCAVNLVDFFFIRKGHYAITDIFNPNGVYGRWSWRGLSCYFLGLMCEVPFMVLSFYTGPVARAMNDIDISFLVGMAVAGLLYLFVGRSIDLKNEQVAISRSDEALASNPLHASELVPQKDMIAAMGFVEMEGEPS